MWGHCKTGIEGADGTWRLLEDATFWELSLACLMGINIDLSYDPAIQTLGNRQNTCSLHSRSTFWKSIKPLTKSVCTKVLVRKVERKDSRKRDGLVGRCLCIENPGFYESKRKNLRDTMGIKKALNQMIYELSFAFFIKTCKGDFFIWNQKMHRDNIF